MAQGQPGLQPASLDTIFAPLDPHERLPREQLIAQNRNWTIWDLRFGRQLVAALLWPLAMLIVVSVTMRLTGSPLAAFAAAGALLVALWRFASAYHSR